MVPRHPKMAQDGAKMGSKMTSGWFRTGPREAHKGTKAPQDCQDSQDDAKQAERAPDIANTAKDSSRQVQGKPKTAQYSAKMDSRMPKTAQGSTRQAADPNPGSGSSFRRWGYFGTLLGFLGGAVLGHLGVILSYLGATSFLDTHVQKTVDRSRPLGLL